MTRASQPVLPPRGGLKIDGVLVQRQPQRVPVVRRGRSGSSSRTAGARSRCAEGERRAGAAAAAEHGEPSPPPPQLDDGGVALAGVQPQAEPDAQVADPVAGQSPAGQERPLDRGQDQSGGGDQARFGSWPQPARRSAPTRLAGQLECAVPDRAGWCAARASCG